VLDSHDTTQLSALVACAWCVREGVWSVEFEDCGHTTPCCDDHYGEYFLGLGWEWLWPADEFEPSCPECSG
jgi:hypothetical protein